MSNRYHSKYHRRNHHTYSNINIPDAGHDPIASIAEPFLGEFILSGSLSAVAPLSSYAAHFYSNNTAICAIGGYEGIFVKGSNDGIQVFSENLAISSYSLKLAGSFASPVRAISANGNFIGADIYSNNVSISSFGKNIGLEVASNNRAISANGNFIGLEVVSPVRAISANGNILGADIYSNNVSISSFGKNIGLEVASNFRAISANGNFIGADIYSNNVSISSFGKNIGLEVASNNRAISANGNFIGADIYSNNVSISSFGKNIGLEVASNFRAISANGNILGADIYSNNVSISSFGKNIGLEVASNNRAISANGNFIGIEVASPVRAISANGNFIGADIYSNNVSISSFGKNIGLEVASNNRAISANGITVAIEAYSLNTPLSTAYGNNIMHGRVGINNNAPTKALDLLGDTNFDGNVTITGNLSTLGYVTRLDTYVVITSAVDIYNKGTGPALTVTQEGNQPIAHFIDSNGDDIVFADDGKLGLGTYTPEANIHIVESTQIPEVRIQSLIDAYNPVLRLAGNSGLNAEGFYIQYDNFYGDTYFKNIYHNATLNKAFHFQTGYNTTTEALTIKSTGQVGILTTEPTESLTVNGNISTNGNILVNDSKFIQFGYNYGANDYGLIKFDFTDDGNSRLIFQTGDNGNEPLVFRQYNNSTPYNRLIIGTDGRVGIGTNTSTTIETFPQQLTVYGGISATEEGYFDKVNINKGTVTQPSLKFQTDSNTGIFSPADDTFSITTNGSEKVRVSQKGDVLLDTYIYPPTSYNNSNYKVLHMASPVSNGSTVVSLASLGNNTSFIGTLSSTGMVIGTETQNIDFKSGMVYASNDILNTGTSRLSIKNGNIGIGTNNPVEKLTIVGNISTTGKINDKWFDPLDFSYVSLREEFGTGGTTSGTIGQLGWNIAGTGVTIENSFSNTFHSIPFSLYIRTPASIITPNLVVGSLSLGNIPAFTGQGLATNSSYKTKTAGLVYHEIANKIAWSLQYSADRTYDKITLPYSFGVRYIPRSSAAWSTPTSYSIGDNIRPTSQNGFKYITTTAGSSYASYPEPTWPTTFKDTVIGYPSIWASTTSYATNYYVRPTVVNAYKYKNIVTGTTTSNGSQPTWPTSVGQLVADTNISIWVTTNSYSLNSVVRPTAVTSGGYKYVNQVTGTTTSNGSQPTWPTNIGDLIADTSISIWATTNSYSLSSVVRPTVVTSGGYKYVNAVTGTTTSNGSQPTWPTSVGQLVADTSISTFTPSIAYSVNNYVRPTVVTSGGFKYKCTVGGTAGAEPVWPTVVGNTVTSGATTWICEAGGYPVWQTQAGGYPVWQTQAGGYPVWITEAADYATWVNAGADGRSDGKFEFFITGANAETNITTYPSTISSDTSKYCKISIRFSSNIVNFSINGENEISHNIGTDYNVHPSFNTRNDGAYQYPDFYIKKWALYSDGWNEF